MESPSQHLNNKTGKHRDALPIVSRHKPTVSPRLMDRSNYLASRLLRDEPALGASDYFGSQVSCGAGTGPALLIGDQRELTLYGAAAISSLQYRIASLAAAGDLVAVAERDEAFEEYLGSHIGLGGVTFIETGDHPVPVAVRCREDPVLFAKIERTLHEHGAMTIIPYLCTGSAWRLAQNLSKATNACVQVCGPPPRLSKRVNDKIWFSNRARQLFGDSALPPTFAAFGPAAAAAHIARLAKTANKVVIKVPNSAGSMGNVVMESKQISNLTLGTLRSYLLKLLSGTGWRGTYPILAGVWDDNVYASPSLQMWIPSVDQGSPIIEGIFEQRVQGTGGKFVGAVRSQLTPGIEGRLVNEAMQFACLFQQLGYFGRCSLDCVLTDSSHTGRQVHWIECNGRWGGVSIPMTLVNRFEADGVVEGLVIVQLVRRSTQTSSTRQTIELLSDLLYECGTSERGVVLLAPTPNRPRSAINLAALGANQDEAEELAERVTERLRL